MLKIINVNDNMDAVRSQKQPIMVEELQVLKYGQPILNLMLSLGSEKAARSLLVTSSDEILSVPLERCHVATTCSSSAYAILKKVANTSCLVNSVPIVVIVLITLTIGLLSILLILKPTVYFFDYLYVILSEMSGFHGDVFC